MNLNIKRIFLLLLCFQFASCSVDHQKEDILAMLDEIKYLQNIILASPDEFVGGNIMPSLQHKCENCPEIISKIKDKCNLQGIGYYHTDNFYSYEFLEKDKYPCYYYLSYFNNINTLSEGVLDDYFPDQRHWAKRLDNHWVFVKSCPNDN